MPTVRLGETAVVVILRSRLLREVVDPAAERRECKDDLRLPWPSFLTSATLIAESGALMGGGCCRILIRGILVLTMLRSDFRCSFQLETGGDDRCDGKDDCESTERFDEAAASEGGGSESDSDGDRLLGACLKRWRSRRMLLLLMTDIAGPASDTRLRDMVRRRPRPRAVDMSSSSSSENCDLCRAASLVCLRRSI